MGNSHYFNITKIVFLLVFTTKNNRKSLLAHELPISEWDHSGKGFLFLHGNAYWTTCTESQRGGGLVKENTASWSPPQTYWTSYWGNCLRIYSFRIPQGIKTYLVEKTLLAKRKPSVFLKKWFDFDQKETNRQNFLLEEILYIQSHLGGLFILIINCHDLTQFLGATFSRIYDR